MEDKKEIQLIAEQSYSFDPQEHQGCQSRQELVGQAAVLFESGNRTTQGSMFESDNMYLKKPLSVNWCQ